MFALRSTAVPNTGSAPARNRHTRWESADVLPTVANVAPLPEIAVSPFAQLWYLALAVLAA